MSLDAFTIQEMKKNANAIIDKFVNKEGDLQILCKPHRSMSIKDKESEYPSIFSIPQLELENLLPHVYINYTQPFRNLHVSTRKDMTS